MSPDAPESTPETTEAAAPCSPRLRGHHLICLQFMHGLGHSADFARNLLRTIERLTEEPGIVAEGGDDLCAACPSLVDGVCVSETEGEGIVRVLDALALEILGLKVGEPFHYGTTSVMVPRILDRWRELACRGCPNEEACTPLIDLTSRFQKPE